LFGGAPYSGRHTINKAIE